MKMTVNVGFFISKLVHLIDRPSLRFCDFSPNSYVGCGVHCVHVKMGKYSYMGNKNVIVNAHIGAFCSIASYCCIGGGNHPTDRLSTSPVFYRGRNIFGKHFSNAPFNSSKAVIIGNDVWIGEKVFIKDGITVGDGVVIGTGAVVTKDVPPYAIVGGVPAKVIKYRFSREIIDKLLEIRWWEKDNEWIEHHSYLFSKENLSLQELDTIV